MISENKRNLEKIRTNQIVQMKNRFIEDKNVIYKNDFLTNMEFK